MLVFCVELLLSEPDAEPETLPEVDAALSEEIPLCGEVLWG